MALTYKFANFFDSEIIQGMSVSDTTLVVTPTAALILPPLGVDERIQLTLWDGVQAPEIVSVTDNPQTGTLTVERGKEGTTARSWKSGTQVAAALTAEVINAALAAYFDFNEVIAANFLPLTGGTLTGPLVLPGIDPTDANHAARKSYVDNILGDKLPLSGGAMSGDINMQGNHIFALPDPVAEQEPATKAYVDAEGASGVDPINDLLHDTSGIIVSGGTNVAYTVEPARTIPENTDGLRIAFRPHVTSGADPTLKVGTAPAMPMKGKPGGESPGGALRAGVPYSLLYSETHGVWLLEGLVDARSFQTLTVAGLATFSSTSHLKLPRGTTAQRPASPIIGDFRYNITFNRPEYFDVNWHALGGTPAGNVVGLQTRVLNNTTLNVTADEAVLVDAYGNTIKFSGVNVNIVSTATPGAGACDAGTRAPDSEYYIWLISNGAVVEGIIHRGDNTIGEAAQLTLPPDYIYKKRVGWAKTEGASNFLRIKQRGDLAQYVVGALPQSSIELETGAKGTFAAISPTLNFVPLPGFIPVLAKSVIICATSKWKGNATGGVLVAPSMDWSGANCGPEGNLGNIWPIYIPAGTDGSIQAEITIEDNLSIAWAGSAAGSAISVFGWRDNI